LVGFFQNFHIFYDILEQIHGLQGRAGAAWDQAQPRPSVPCSL
jgi:hypothetical protein